MKPPVARTGLDDAAPRLSRPLRWALGLTLLGTALVTWLPEEEDSLPQTRASAAPASPQAGALPWPAGPAPRADEPPPRVAADAAAAWADDGPGRSNTGPTAAAAPAASAPATPPPAAPAYQLIGLLDEDGHVRALLQAGPRTLVVAEGDTLDARWTVERVTERSVTLRAADGNTRHTLRFKPA